MKILISIIIVVANFGCHEAPENSSAVSGHASAAEPLAKHEAITITTSTGWRIVVAEGKGTATKGQRMVALFTDLDEFEEGIDERNPIVSQESNRIISAVGSIVSIAQSYHYEGRAHPYYGTIWKALDLETGEPASLRTIFPEDEIFAVLRTDRVVKEAYMGDLLGEPSSLMGLISGLDGGCAMRFSPDMLSQFAFHHIRENQVAVRIGLTHGCEVDRGNFTQLGLYLNTPTDLSEPLARAKADGTLMETMGAQ